MIHINILFHFVQELKKDYATKGIDEIEIYCTKSRVSLNGKEARQLFKYDVDLAKVKWNYFGRNEWVLD